ncbi:hypothetical protein MKW98_014726, partial [Papaver atlanticum]
NRIEVSNIKKKKPLLLWKSCQGICFVLKHSPAMGRPLLVRVLPANTVPATKLFTLSRGNRDTKSNCSDAQTVHSPPDFYLKGL